MAAAPVDDVAARSWDLVVVGAGPAGAATAIGALRARPGLAVLLLDRADFPRDKTCGDGVAPHVVELLAAHGVHGIVDDRVPVARLRLERAGRTAARAMRRPAWVVPRAVLDARLVEAAQQAGARLVRHRVRRVERSGSHLLLDGAVRGAVLVGADGVHSVVRPLLGGHRAGTALALRGYAPVAECRRGEQAIVFGDAHSPSYAWSFDRGDGLANVGYGELLAAGRPAPSRRALIARLESLLPGATRAGGDWRGHHLPLSSSRWRPPDGPVLLAGDAAGLVNPMTGEGIYYAVATGLAAGRVAAEAVCAADPGSAGQRYRRATSPLLSWHLRHTAVAGRLAGSGTVLDAGLSAAAHDQGVFDDLVELGLANGRVTARVVAGLARAGLIGLVAEPGRLRRRA